MNIIEELQQGGLLPTVTGETNIFDRINRVNPNTYQFNPTTPTSSLIQSFGVINQQAQREQADRQLDQDDQRLDMEVTKFNKDLISSQIQKINGGTDPTYLLNLLSPGGIKLHKEINGAVESALDIYNSAFAESMTNGKVTPISLGKLNQANAQVDKILRSPEYATHVAANKAYVKMLDDSLKASSNPKVFFNSEKFKEYEDQFMQVMNNPSSIPKDFSLSSLFNINDLITDRLDYEEDTKQMFKDYVTGNTKSFQEFLDNNPYIVQTTKREDLKDMTKLPEIIVKNYMSNAQGRAYIDSLGGEEKAIDYWTKYMYVTNPNAGQTIDTVTDINNTKIPKPETETSSPASLSVGERESLGIKGALNEIGYDTTIPLDKDSTVEVNLPPADGLGTGSVVKYTIAQALSVLRDKNSTPAQKKAMEDAFALKKYEAPVQGKGLGANFNSQGAIQTEFSKFTPEDTDWDTIARRESSNNPDIIIHEKGNKPGSKAGYTAGLYGLHGSNIKGFFNDVYGAKVDPLNKNEVSTLYKATRDKNPEDFDRKQREWIYNNVQKPLLNYTLENQIYVMDNSLKTYLADLAHNTGTEGYKAVVELALKNLGGRQENPAEVLKAVHDARVSKLGDSEGDINRFNEVYAASVQRMTPKAQVASKLPFAIAGERAAQSHQSYLELNENFLNEIYSTVANSPVAPKMEVISLARGAEHPATKKNKESLHPKGGAVDFRKNGFSTTRFTELVGRDLTKTPYDFVDIPGTNMMVQYESDPPHYHLQYKGDLAAKPEETKPVGPRPEDFISDIPEAFITKEERLRDYEANKTATQKTLEKF